MAGKKQKWQDNSGDKQLTTTEWIEQVMIISGMVGAGGLLWLLNPQVQYFLSYFPRDFVVNVTIYGFCIPVVYCGLKYGFKNRTKIGRFLLKLLDMITVKEVEDAEDAPKARGDVIDLLPAPPKMEYDRSGQGYARTVPSALEHIGLTKPEERVKVLSATPGPMATQVVIELPPGFRLSRLIKATADIKAAIHAPSVSITQGPKAHTAAIVIAYEEKQSIVLKQVISTPEYLAEIKKSKSIVYPVGVDVLGKPLFSDFSNTAHLLVAGATGSGKSVWINQFLISLLVNYSPAELRIALIDPKMVELAPYKKYPHLLSFADTAETALVLFNLLDQETKTRYKMFQQVGARNISGYRQKTGKTMPYVVCVVDEFAELMIGGSGKDEKAALVDMENRIQSLCQLSRAAGIHLLIATQKPLTSVISSKIKSNLPGRISFALAGLNAYSVILDNFPPGTTLMGKGDGLAEITGLPEIPTRFQGVMVGLNDDATDRAIEKICDYWIEKGVTPAPVTAFNGTYVPRHLVGSEDNDSEEDDTHDMPLDQNPGQIVEKKPLEIQIRRLVAELAAYAEEGEIVLKRSTEIAKDFQSRRETVDEVLNALAAEGWVSEVMGSKRGAKRVILLSKEDAHNCLVENGIISN